LLFKVTLNFIKKVLKIHLQKGKRPIRLITIEKSIIDSNPSLEATSFERVSTQIFSTFIEKERNRIMVLWLHCKNNGNS
jgi:hypothetical protein